MNSAASGTGRRRFAAPYLAAFGAILCWASLAAAVGRSLERVAPELILFYGLLTAGLALALRGVVRRRRLPAWPGWRTAALGLFGIWGYHQLLVSAFALAPDVEANILNYTWTLWIVLLGSLLPGNRFSLRILAAGLLGFAGVSLAKGASGRSAPAILQARASTLDDVVREVQKRVFDTR